jgi:hypothetical protein
VYVGWVVTALYLAFMRQQDRDQDTPPAKCEEIKGNVSRTGGWRKGIWGTYRTWYKEWEWISLSIRGWITSNYLYNTREGASIFTTCGWLRFGMEISPHVKTGWAWITSEIAFAWWNDIDYWIKHSDRDSEIKTTCSNYFLHPIT